MGKLSRHQERIWALQILYSLDLKGELNREKARIAINNFKNEHLLEPKTYYFEELVLGVITKIQQYDQLINEKAINWDIQRMAFVDRNILRLAVFELENKLPVGVAIDEAVELAKEYGDEKSAAFINGILAKINF